METFTTIISFVVLIMVGIPLIQWRSSPDFKKLDKIYNSSDDIHIIDSNTKSEEIANLVTVYAPEIDFQMLRNKIKELLDE